MTAFAYRARSPLRRDLVLLCSPCGATRVRTYESGEDQRIGKPEPISRETVKAWGRGECAGCGREILPLPRGAEDRFSEEAWSREVGNTGVPPWGGR